MKVLFLGIHPFFASPNGSDEHMRWLADRLVERGHVAAFHTIAMRDTPAEGALIRARRLRGADGRIHGHPVGWHIVPPADRFPPLLYKGVVARAIEAHAADFVIIPGGDALLGQFCRQNGAPTLVIGCHGAWVAALADPIFKANLEGLSVAAVSAAVADVALAEIGVRPWLLPHGIDPERVVGRLRTYDERLKLPIGMVNASRRKGAPVLADVAASLPMLRFVATRSTDAEIPVPMPTNVTDAGVRTSMRAFYGNLQMLLVPSLWFEAGARVVTEAQLNGIPVLGTDRGALVEALSEAPFPVRQWVLEPWKDPIVASSIARPMAERIAALRAPDAYRDAVIRGLQRATAHQEAALASVDRLEAVMRGDAR